MKRIFFAWVTLALCSNPLVRGQDAATQQRLDELNGRIQNLIEGQETLTKQVNDLRRELAAVRDLASKPTGNWASPEDLKSLKKYAEDVDRRRAADSELVQKQLEKIRQALDRPLPPPKRSNSTTPKDTAVSDTPPTPREGVEHVVKSGETISSIVQACKEQKIKVTQKQILDANPGLKPEKLRAGQKIFIPGVPQP
jgi:LysM repeat protein